MLPVTHGDKFTRLHILLYTIILVLITIMPYLIGMSGLVYLAGAMVLNIDISIGAFASWLARMKRILCVALATAFGIC